jgi:hypothetical protein
MGREAAWSTVVGVAAHLLAPEIAYRSPTVDRRRRR